MELLAVFNFPTYLNSFPIFFVASVLACPSLSLDQNLRFGRGNFFLITKVAFDLIAFSDEAPVILGVKGKQIIEMFVPKLLVSGIQLIPRRTLMV